VIRQSLRTLLGGVAVTELGVVLFVVLSRAQQHLLRGAAPFAEMQGGQTG
jgi:hypothetical protein